MLENLIVSGLFIFIAFMFKLLSDIRKQNTEEFIKAYDIRIMEMTTDKTFFPVNASARINELIPLYKGKVDRKVYNTKMNDLWQTYKLRKTFAEARQSNDHIMPARKLTISN